MKTYVRCPRKRAVVSMTLLLILAIAIPGCLIVSIDPQLDNPYEITLSGVIELLPIGENMTVTATVEDEFGCVVCPEEYEWYLSGSRLPGNCGTITLGRDLNPGLYELDLIVTKDGVPSSEGASFEVVANS